LPPHNNKFFLKILIKILIKKFFFLNFVSINRNVSTNRNNGDVMIPDLNTVKDLYEKYDGFLFQKEVAGDIINPIILLKKMDNFAYSFLLESAKTDDKILARYSFIGYDPEEIIKYQNGFLEVGKGEKKETYKLSNPFYYLKKDLSKMVYSNNIGDFKGGFLGFISYECVNYCDVLRKNIKEGDFPVLLLMRVNKFFVYDNYTGKLYASVYINKEKDYYETYRRAEDLINKMIESLFSLDTVKKRTGKVLRVDEDLKREDYINTVSKVKGEIESGEGIQVVISKKYDVYFDSINPISFYRSLRNLNPSPYMFYLKFNDFVLLGSSPETHLKVKDRVGYIKPIAGTYPINKSSVEEDKKKLLSDKKEVAEHLMLLDLARNDLYTCCDPKTVEVEKSFVAEEYSHVLHIVSSVKGVLKEGIHPIELFAKTFPAGTVTGAPKVRAIELIEQYEASPRGFYAGCVGYFGYNSDIDTCITIRSAIVRGNTVTLRAGAGIVYDSIPDREADEVENKLKALFKALDRIKDLEENYVFTR